MCVLRRRWFDLAAIPQIWIPYLQVSTIAELYIALLHRRGSFDLLNSFQLRRLILNLQFEIVVWMCDLKVSRLSRIMLRYLTSRSTCMLLSLSLPCGTSPCVKWSRHFCILAGFNWIFHLSSSLANKGTLATRWLPRTRMAPSKKSSGRLRMRQVAIYH